MQIVELVGGTTKGATSGEAIPDVIIFVIFVK
jgi:hypothetical protein